MSTNFPAFIDSFVNPLSGQPMDNPNQATLVTNLNDAVLALQRKVGVNGSTDILSIDYLLAHNTGGGGGGAVSSVFGRIGAVTAQSGDYNASQVGADSLGAAAAAQAASVPIAGGTMTGFLTLSGNPTNSAHAATKNYVDSTASGLTVRPSCVVATTTSLPSYTYSNGTSGVGATITATATGALTIDSHVILLNDRILVKNEGGALAPFNGIYTCTTAGAVGVAYVLTRTTDMDQGTEFTSAYTFITGGSINLSTGWVCTVVGVLTVGTGNVTFSQFSASTSYTAGTGLALTGTTFSLPNAGPGATGPIGGATSIPIITIDPQGRVTALTSTTITAGTVTNVSSDSTIVVTSSTTTPGLSRAALSGDITAPAGSNTTTLKNTGPGATGPIGSPSVTPVITIDAQGRTTALGSANIAIPESSVTNLTSDLSTLTGNVATKLVSITASDSTVLIGGTVTAPTISRTALTGDITTSLNVATLALSGVTAGSYGSSTQIPVIVVDAKGRVTSASNTNATPSITITSQSGTSYTLILTDGNTEIEFTNAAAIALTVPNNTTVAYPVGTVINIRQMGTGQITVTPTAGVTINTPNGLKSRVQYSTISIIKNGTNTWVLGGDSTT